MRLGYADESNFPEDTSTKKAYNLLVDGFGVGFNGPLLLVADLPEGFDRSQLDQVAARRQPRRRGRHRRHRASRRRPTVSENGRAAFWRRDPHHRPAGRRRRRASSTACATTCCPPVEDATGATVHVSGPVAIHVDFTERPGRAACRWFFGAVLGLSFLLLMAVFRSLLVPLEGGDHEPADDRRGLRRGGRPVPVGLARATSPASRRRRSSRGCR